MVVAAVAYLRAQAVAIDSLPSEWRERAEVRDDLSEALRWRPVAFLRSFQDLGFWFTVLTAWFALLSFIEIPSTLQLLLCFALAVFWIRADMAEAERGQRQFMEEAGVSPLPREGTLRFGFWGSLFIIRLSFPITCSFLGLVVAIIVNGG